MSPLPHRRIVGWLAAALLLAGLPAAAAMRYQPKPEETLSHVALIHYGDPKKLVYLTAVNGIADPDRMPSGRKLTIPVSWTYSVRKGDDLARIARKQLGDAKRADFLLWLNGLKEGKELKPGTALMIPFVIHHPVQEGQSMLDVARRYYWSTKPAGLLRKWNGRKTNALKPGELVEVPIYDREALADTVQKRLQQFEEKQRLEAEAARERARKEALARAKEPPAGTGGAGADPAAAALTPEVRAALGDAPAEAASVQTSSRAAEQLQEALAMLREGDFELTQATLDRLLLSERLSRTDEAEARYALAVCLVALDRLKEAEHEFVRLLMIDPERDRKLDPAITSPKVLDVMRRAKGGR
ncbi:MAG TPA: LysM domain-containing protein [Myxococcota bacterium]|nr:LysM domain-containing protein [Myxococcota bacterium]HRY96453.1 LysM domain-containing protein [Myxococcota bacterium]HSA22348.1 LysM domain-containing protein [Myxococcota bacterium]